MTVWQSSVNDKWWQVRPSHLHWPHHNENFHWIRIKAWKISINLMKELTNTKISIERPDFIQISLGVYYFPPPYWMCWNLFCEESCQKWMQHPIVFISQILVLVSMWHKGTVFYCSLSCYLNNFLSSVALSSVNCLG